MRMLAKRLHDWHDSVVVRQHNLKRGSKLDVGQHSLPDQQFHAEWRRSCTVPGTMARVRKIFVDSPTCTELVGVVSEAESRTVDQIGELLTNLSVHDMLPEDPSFCASLLRVARLASYAD